jgi:spore germination protein
LIYNDFIHDLTNALKPQGFRVAVTVTPKFADLPTGSWVGAFDYAVIGRFAALVFIMTYEWGWIGGSPMAVAPLPSVRRALVYAVSQIPPIKIIQGVSLL